MHWSLSCRKDGRGRHLSPCRTYLRDAAGDDVPRGSGGHGVEGRKIAFAVRAYDEAGEIGHGTHERFAVEGGPFLAKAAKKKR